ncbi:beta-alanine-activating enzyme-like [Haliotis asinina]|uniref:beta-alanine-activating enzyme-like n=1 Tax=Haliotis asinina TaxID=109174 RepID=UPI003531FD91
MMETLHSLVEKQVSGQCYKVAVQFDDGINKSFITYQDLCNTANIVSEVLRSRGVDNETVGLCVSPSVHLPSVLLGVLQTPASFFPFDSDGRVYLRQALLQVGARFLLVDVDHLQRLEDVTNTLHGAVVPCMELFELGLVLVSLQDILPRPHANSLAYCITTSGTTSVPKVVRVPHSCIVPNIQHLRKMFELKSEDLCFLASPLTFDPSIVEIFVTLTSGASLLITNNEVKSSPKKLLEILCHRNSVSVLQMTPSLLLRFGPSVLRTTLLSRGSSVRILALGGENLPTRDILRSAMTPDCPTTFYNLYGVTEVSCWATCFQFTSTFLEKGEGGIPLGSVLDRTEVKVIDNEGRQVTSGEGRLQIGSSERVCLLNEETGDVMESLPVWRETGDIVCVQDDSTIVYVGRLDDQIKRHGKRLNTSAIQHAVQQLPAIMDSRVLSLGDRLLLFVVSEAPCEDTQHVSLKTQVTSHLQEMLPLHYQPDQVMLVDQIPLTKHGKTDSKLLTRMWEDVAVRMSPTLPTDVRRWCGSLWQDHLPGRCRDVQDTDEFLVLGGNSLQAVHLVNIVEDKLGEQSTLLLDTLLNKAFLDFVQHIQQMMANVPDKDDSSVSVEEKTDHPEALPATSQGQDEATVSAEEQRDDPAAVSAIQKSQDEAAVSVEEKRDLPGTVPATPDQPAVSEPVSDDVMEGIQDGSNSQMNLESENCLTEHVLHKFTGSVSRGSRYQGTAAASLSVPVRLPMASIVTGLTDLDWMSNISTEQVSSPTDLSQDHMSGPSGGEKDGVLMDGVNSRCPGGDHESVSMSLCWKYDTEKCVDASPLVAVSSTGSHVVYIGSHSYLMCAIDLTNGCELWQTRLGDRVESSACLSQCGRWVVVGCYDNCIYVLCAVSGDIKWTYKTGGCVKSSPTLDPLTSHIIIGSHDGCLHSVDINRHRCVWRQSLDNGSVFSSPCVSRHHRHVYVGTLGSNLHAVNPDTGEVLWSRDTAKPIFSSPAENHSGVIVGCVDGSILCFNHHGDKTWTFSTDGPVFSSPLVITPSLVPACTSSEPEDVVLVGSHDMHLYCLTMTGKRLWRWAADSAIYTTPFVWHQLAQQVSGQRKTRLASRETSLEEELHYQTELSNGIAFPSAAQHLTFSSDSKLADSVKHLLVDRCRLTHVFCKCSLHRDKCNDCKPLPQGLYSVSGISSVDCVTCCSLKHKTVLSTNGEPCVKKQRYHIDSASNLKEVPVYEHDLCHTRNHQKLLEPTSNSEMSFIASCQKLGMDHSSMFHQPLSNPLSSAAGPQGKSSELNLCLDDGHSKDNNQNTSPTSQQISDQIDQHLICLPKRQLPSDTIISVHSDSKQQQAPIQNIPHKSNPPCTEVHPRHSRGSQDSPDSLSDMSKSGAVFPASLLDKCTKRTASRVYCGFGGYGCVSRESATASPARRPPSITRTAARECCGGEGSRSLSQECHTAFPARCPPNGGVVYVASTNGNLTALCVTTGQQLDNTRLPGEVFSSPVVVDGRLVVGCRDNNVYCFTVGDI